MKKAVLILPHQLFEKHPCLPECQLVYLAELDYFFNRFSFHKQKLALHYSSMFYYRDFLKKKGYKVVYCGHKDVPTLDKLIGIIKKDGATDLFCTDLIEHDLNSDLKSALKKYKISCTIYKSPMFVTSEKLLSSYFNRNLKRFVMGHFYRKQRKELNLLVGSDGNPVGGKWSFDELNREPLPETLKLPRIYRPVENKYYKQAKKYVYQFYKNNPGELKTTYPSTHRQAKAALDNFLKNRLYYFGPYQDAVSTDSNVIFHSQLSLLLNIGLLTPEYVVKKTMGYAKKNNIPINSLEGFLRQLVGWREFVWGIYRFHGSKQKKGNYWNNKWKLTEKWWKGQTGIDPVDMVIENVLRTGYAHHIERLMILGNVMLLCETAPDSVYQWFMELFVDSYDWVMVPNVYGMSQFADGGLMATKPYISSSSYIKKMGNFERGSWQKLWDALFWNFIQKHRKQLKKNARLAGTVSLLSRMKGDTLKEHIKRARNYLGSVDFS